MIDNLRRRFTLLFTVSTGTILTIVLCILFFWQNSTDKNQKIQYLQNQVLDLTYRLEGTSNFSDEWLARVENSGRMVIHIEENQIPLFFRGSYVPQTDREQLISRAKKAAKAQNIDTNVRPYSSTLVKSSLFTVEGSHHDSYQGICVVIAAKDNGIRSLILLADTGRQEQEKRLQIVLFAALEFVSLLALYLVSRVLAAKAVAPAAEYHQKQTEFVAAASHELRSPLALIQNCADAALDVPEQAASMNGIIKEECIRCAKLIQNLLLLASADSKALPAESKEVEIDTLLLRLFENYEPLCSEKNIRLRLLLPEELLPAVNGSPEWIYQILSVFLDNAVAYGCPKEEKKRIELCAEIREAVSGRKKIRTPHWTRPVRHPDLCLRISVRDHGDGIPDEKKQAVFERFTRGDASRRDKAHFGLGLSLAASLASQMGIPIGLEDTPGGGCTFYMEFTIPW